MVSNSKNFAAKTGGPFTKNGFKANWQKLNDEGISWTFHDLKAMEISDFEGNKQNISGHE